MPVVPIQFSDETPLHQIDLPSRLRNALQIEGVKTVGEVRNMADADLLSFQNIGAASVRNLRQLFGASRSDPRRKGRGGG
jgi:DNA-directed RNA polymerase alpha subunit